MGDEDVEITETGKECGKRREENQRTKGLLRKLGKAVRDEDRKETFPL
jgi:hypothetical protein